MRASRTVVPGDLALLLLLPFGLVFYRTFEGGAGAVLDSVTTGDHLRLLADAHDRVDRGAAQHRARRGHGARPGARPLPRQGEAVIDMPFAVSPVAIGFFVVREVAPVLREG